MDGFAVWFTGARERQLIDDDDPARMRIGGAAFKAEGLELFRRHECARVAGNGRRRREAFACNDAVGVSRVLLIRLSNRADFSVVIAWLGRILQ